FGTITCVLHVDAAPIGVANFVGLARGRRAFQDPMTKKWALRRFYDGLTFHRVIPGFMAQGGDPRGTGTGGSEKPDLKAEFSREPHVRGICSMARTANPNSANSQFFICFDDADFLDGQYTVWGEVVEGMDNVDALPKGEPPRNPGKIVSMTVAADAA
ncbi:MAG: peptidyl-prolyl cis-trans isomerase, cyclophilin-type, partial [Phenylobacterium sp.]|nr:peptidyl-prolyl cis-trans isomerase, cyclophilin-type [Phenylobacterium sp.]